MVKIEVSKKDLKWITPVILVAIAGLAIAYGGNSPSVSGHSSGEIDVTINGARMTLQQAINNGEILLKGSTAASPVRKIAQGTKKITFTFTGFGGTHFNGELFNGTDFGLPAGQNLETGTYLVEIGPISRAGAAAGTYGLSSVFLLTVPSNTNDNAAIPIPSFTSYHSTGSAEYSMILSPRAGSAPSPKINAKIVVVGVGNNEERDLPYKIWQLE